ncbi:hypothetical protein J3Q64DRAFT_1001985 [Phycomyces blakesleeanus]|uniref:Protein yippee-like n=2 Tax=Phycomyces blakesleeanus TaxID=4837 RepID=A0A167PIA8_PHYB8|nr:hypothetical protein PHYBLDRAFT_108806 [Phycomyces blakesleeanus NRRL 1555(-)]OAD77984.1 hypothetical protein PHYBLDRAFT_108806 [Phycomyces blakesleeanus NRRL 1555(-)]|eukprot:XP_018296024.1 hypothetical protein PHYBLDRAFT_108806 [Phycomyces blakesleeanus NRRL 1555(-)]
MTKRPQVYLPDECIYSCSTCHSHVACHDSIISKVSSGKHGPGYLVDEVVNVGMGEREERVLPSGPHIIADIYCCVCHATIGWKHIIASKEEERYKDGLWMIEQTRVVKERL